MCKDYSTVNHKWLYYVYEGKIVYTLGDETDLLDDIKEGIEIALYREGYSGDDIDSIDLNKLAYLAITDLNVPITFGWYKYGPAPVNVQRQNTQLTAKPRDRCRAADEPRILTPNNQFRSPEEYSYYFTEDLPWFTHIVGSEPKEYLKEFYEQYAPSEYADLYTECVKLQLALDYIKENSNWHSSAEIYHNNVVSHLNETKRQLIAEPSLSEAVDPFFEYCRLLKNVLTSAANISEISASQQRFLKNLINFFYGSAWNYVALLISQNTVDLSPGTNQRRLRDSIDNDLRELRNEYNSEFVRLEEKSLQHDLLPESYTISSDDAPERPEPVEQDLDVVESWTKISSEVYLDDLC